ncbi:MAG: prolyl oligopeptidase family serine peptidase, partial [Frankiaceae bacterium]|nr:prolyl oligopeptidase family serine peptidase [Frankiaceae bacterium]
MNRRLVSGLALIVTTVVAAPATDAIALGHHRAKVRNSLPADAPQALYRTQPRLPTPHGWPGVNNAFSQTSGTGRYARGGYFWSDYIYDDHGATTTSTGGISVTAGSPSFGLYTYPDGAASQNGADIFRAAVLRRAHATYWRVDWNTLVKRRVPIAEWTFDTDNKSSTGGSSWPAGAGASSPGIERALVMSSHGARLINTLTGKVLIKRPVTSDLRAQSFVARIPNRVLHPRGRWRIRLAAGLADSRGTGFRSAPNALSSQTHVYNVTFRTRAQEKPANNFWNDMKQTSSLDAGNVAEFSRVLRWKALHRHRRTRVPVLRGWSDRWYVSRVSLGPGIVTAPRTIEDNQANYLGRVQPYAVYVPKSYSRKRPSPLTFLLHSLTQNQNQYAATTPHFVQEACEQRHSICATTLGRGPDGFYYGTAQLDFWQVWHQVAAAFRLDPNRTILAGYSMGGIGTNEIAMAHPDLFARAVTLAGAVGQVPSLANLRWVPMYLAGGAE